MNAMTREEFKSLPHLVSFGEAMAVGYSRATIEKFAACGILAKIQPLGYANARYQKKQLAQLLKWDDLLEPAIFLAESPLMQTKTVHRWTGYSETALFAIAHAGGLTYVKPPSAGSGKFLKLEVAKLIGFEQYV